MKFNQKSILIILLVFLIVFDIQPPDFIQSFLHSYIGMFVVVAIVLALFSLSALIGSLGLIASYMLYSRIPYEKQFDINDFVPDNTKKNKFFRDTKNNHFPKTLEEEMIKNMVPYVNDNYTDSSYIPTSNNTRDAQRL